MKYKASKIIKNHIKNKTMGRTKEMWMDSWEYQASRYNEQEQVRRMKAEQHEYFYHLQQDINKTNLIFVYGTLMRGYHNHPYIQDGKFLSKALTTEQYQMTASGIPFVNKLIPTSRIVGELYQVDNVMTLHGLDALEGHPHGYCREIIQVEDETHEIHDAWLYFYNKSQGIIVESGSYQNYDRPKYF